MERSKIIIKTKSLLKMSKACAPPELTTSSPEMAPAKRKSDEQQPATNTNTTVSSRVTRSSTRAANAGVAAASAIIKPPVPSPKVVKKNKKAKISPDEKKQVETTKAVEGSKTIVIEHCKQCNQFKNRAFQVKDGLESGVPGISVLINPEKPRRGCFEIREEGGEKFISLLDMNRPFAPMKALDMDHVISDIINKIK